MEALKTYTLYAMATTDFNISTVIFKLKKIGLSLEKLKRTIEVLNEQRLYLKNKAKIVSFIEFKKITQEINQAQLQLTKLNVENDELIMIKLNYEKNKKTEP